MNRRQALLTLAGCVLWPAAAQALPVPPKPRRLRLVNAHTGETFDGVYRDQSGPIPRVVDELCVFFRDFHCGAVTRMDVGVFDFLADTIDAVGATRATVLSAYRTPATNAMLARTMFGVAENSQHLYGRALDISLDRGLEQAMEAARAMRRGGVGWYAIRISFTSTPGRCATGPSTTAGWAICCCSTAMAGCRFRPRTAR